ncbi:MAG: hypothetical protein ACT4P7_00110 [Gemmatimonadaceae bacterium]
MSQILRLALVTGALVPSLLPSQTTVAANATVASSYIWRGLTFTNASVVQPKVTVTRSGVLGSLSLFAAGNFEPTTAGSPTAIRQGGSHVGLSELDLVAQWTKSVLGTSLTAGWIGYRFNERNTVMTSAFNTDELFGAVKFDHLPLAPSVTAYADVGVVKGLYLEGSLVSSFNAGRTVTLTALAGLAAGQERRGDQDTFYNFAQRGLTHVDFGATTSFGAFGVTISPSVHVQLSPSGQNTRVSGALPAHSDRGHKEWFAIDIGWAR